MQQYTGWVTSRTHTHEASTLTLFLRPDDTEEAAAGDEHDNGTEPGKAQQRRDGHDLGERRVGAVRVGGGPHHRQAEEGEGPIDDE